MQCVYASGIRVGYIQKIRNKCARGLSNALVQGKLQLLLIADIYFTGNRYNRSSIES